MFQHPYSSRITMVVANHAAKTGEKGKKLGAKNAVFNNHRQIWTYHFHIWNLVQGSRVRTCTHPI